MKDIIIFYIIVAVCLIINLLLLLKDGYKYSELFFYYIIVLSIILGLGILLSEKYYNELDIIDKYHFEWNQQLENTHKCKDKVNNCRNPITWDNGIVHYDLSEIGDKRITIDSYLEVNLIAAYIMLGFLLILNLLLLVYLVKNIYYHYQRKKYKKVSKK